MRIIQVNHNDDLRFKPLPKQEVFQKITDAETVEIREKIILLTLSYLNAKPISGRLLKRRGINKGQPRTPYSWEDIQEAMDIGRSETGILNPIHLKLYHKTHPQRDARHIRQQIDRIRWLLFKKGGYRGPRRMRKGEYVVS